MIDNVADPKIKSNRMTTSLTDTDGVVTVLSNQSVSYRFYNDKPNLVFYQHPAGETDSLYVPGIGMVYTAEPAGAHHLLLNKGLNNESYFHTSSETRVPTDRKSDVAGKSVRVSVELGG